MGADCMKTIQKSVLLWHSAHEMFALVTDVQHYPQFLPWCDHSEVIERETIDGMVARVGMAISGMQARTSPPATPSMSTTVRC